MLVYILIFIAKLIEVSMATIRNVLINRGEKLKGALIGFFEVMLWVIVVNNVLSNLQSDPIQLLIYCLAFAMGNYLGVMIENKLAIGTSSLQVVVSKEKESELANNLREKGFGVTIMQGEGKNGPVSVLAIFLKRKAVPEAIELIHTYAPSTLVTVNDVRHLSNGFIRK